MSEKSKMFEVIRCSNAYTSGRSMLNVATGVYESDSLATGYINIAYVNRIHGRTV